jgi:hypothetical protein
VKRDFIVQNLWPRGWSGGTLEILNQIIPPVVRFIGPEDILKELARPEIQGKVLRLGGDLYVSDRIFLLISKRK